MTVKFTKVMVWGAGCIAVVVFNDIWYQHFGSYHWGAFPSIPFLRQVLLPATVAGAIFGLAAWFASKQR